MSSPAKLHLFEGYGIELEYMIVNRHTLAAMPIANLVLEQLAGKKTREVFKGRIAWSNEIVLHVIELKANGPTADLVGLRQDFSKALTEMQIILDPFEAMLLPTSMHPFFDPDTETRIWEGEDAEIYQTYDQVFGCKGHGWSNLQSIHINFPFSGDAEFGILHSAIRAVLPLLPAIAQSSPIVEGTWGPSLDSRLFYYFQNQRRLPTIIGPIIPEPVYTEKEYNIKILQPMYREISPLDPEGELQEEWLNSRAAIARFSRNAVEIRLLDIGESLEADFAVIALTIALVKALAASRWCDSNALKGHSSESLRAHLMAVIDGHGDALIHDKGYLALFGKNEPQSAMMLWSGIFSDLVASDPMLAQNSAGIKFILEHGAVGKRLAKMLPKIPSKADIVDVYRKVATCLRENSFLV
jgi:gamma-glutamyl:cysteine ligase YbdK (ATP-grasp superfamily)